MSSNLKTGSSSSSLPDESRATVSHPEECSQGPQSTTHSLQEHPQNPNFLGEYSSARQDPNKQTKGSLSLTSGDSSQTATQQARDRADTATDLFPSHDITAEEAKTFHSIKYDRRYACHCAWSPKLAELMGNLPKDQWADLTHVPNTQVDPDDDYTVSGSAMFTGQTILGHPDRNKLHAFWKSARNDDFSRRDKELYITDEDGDQQSFDQTKQKNVVINMWNSTCNIHKSYLPSAGEEDKANKNTNWTTHAISMTVFPPEDAKGALPLVITQTSQNFSEDSKATITHLTVSDTSGSDPTHVWHFQTDLWPDCGVPSEEDRPYIEGMMRESLAKRHEIENSGSSCSMLHHCGVGYGRAPTASIWMTLIDAAEFGRKLPYLDHPKVHKTALDSRFADNYICKTIDDLNITRPAIQTWSQCKLVLDLCEEKLATIKAKLGDSIYKRVRSRAGAAASAPSSDDASL